MVFELFLDVYEWFEVGCWFGFFMLGVIDVVLRVIGKLVGKFDLMGVVGFVLLYGYWFFFGEGVFVRNEVVVMNIVEF